jgi:hypothetical protein
MVEYLFNSSVMNGIWRSLCNVKFETYHGALVLVQYVTIKTKLSSVALVREGIIPTERPQLVGEVSANFFANRRCLVVGTTNPHGCILYFLDRSRYFSFQLAPQLCSRGWVDPVADPLLLRKSVSVCRQELWPLGHRGGLQFLAYTTIKQVFWTCTNKWSLFLPHATGLTLWFTVLWSPSNGKLHENFMQPPICCLAWKSDRLCGLVVRVSGYRSRGPGSIPDFLRSSQSGTRCIQPREYNWGATRKKK